MKIDVSKYDIEVLDVEGQWCGLDDVINLDYATSTISAGGKAIRRMVESVAIDCIIDGQITAMVYEPERVNVTRRQDMSERNEIGGDPTLSPEWPGL